MKLYISHSREDKVLVSNIARRISDEMHHEVWFDQRALPAQEWWPMILSQIQMCDCFVYVITLKSYRSIYCKAELDYALALNKPILPLLRDNFEPNVLVEREVEFWSIGNDLNKNMSEIESGLHDLETNIAAGKFIPPTAPVAPIPQPILGKGSPQIPELYLMAEEAVFENNLSLGEFFFQQVIATQPEDFGWGQVAADRWAEICRERESGEPSQAIDNASIANPTLGSRMVDRKGVTMVYVPAGSFLMGSDPALEPEAKDYEMPQHTQTLERGFWIDLTPVTNQSFARFVAEGGYRTRAYWTDEAWEWVRAANVTGPSHGMDHELFSIRPDQPCVGMERIEADAYCRWRGGQLPNEIEWEYAARGPENRIYPWGNTFEPDRAFYIDSGTPYDSAVVGSGIREAGAAWCGALDMSGNVGEWCINNADPYPLRAADLKTDMTDGCSNVSRGGWFVSPQDELRGAARMLCSGRGGMVGLRCIHY